MQAAWIFAGCAVLCGAALGQQSAVSTTPPDLALVRARVIAAPDAAPQPNVTVVVRKGVITAMGVGARVPRGAKVLDCAGKTVVAGFWNSHVHFMEQVWSADATAPAAPLEDHMQQMLTRWGFTTVWDLGSAPATVHALQMRIAAGGFAGPRILVAGDIFPAGGHPAYLPREMQLPEASSPQEAAAMAADYLSSGDNGIKLFTGAYMGEGHPVINMPTEIARAAVDVAHKQGAPVFAHPQNYAGVDNALNAGVDVLAHTIPTENGWKPEELAQMQAQHTALVPTLALWRIVMEQGHAAQQTTEHFVQAGVEELRAFAAQGGVVLFGTDVGFHQEYDTTHELEYMGRALTWKQVLAALTTNPCDYFKQKNCGRVAVGEAGDLVVLDADPAQDVKNFARVQATIRNGQVIYRRSGTGN